MLYFIKGASPKNWGAMKLKLTKGASPSAVIAGMEKDGWKSVTVSAFNAWRKQNSRPTQRAADVALCSCLHPGQLKNGVCQKCGLPYFRPAANA